MQTAPYFCTILTKFVSRQIFIEVFNVKFHVNSSDGSAQTLENKQTDRKADGQTDTLPERQKKDGRNEANRHIPRLGRSVKKKRILKTHTIEPYSNMHEMVHTLTSRSNVTASREMLHQKGMIFICL
jgi:hypothetical protein